MNDAIRIATVGFLLVSVLVARAQTTTSADMNAQAAAAAGMVTSKYGSASGMNSGLGQPLASPTPMQTVDGSQSFGAQVSCPATSAYLQVTMFPTNTGDLQQITIDQDQNFSGSYTAHYLMSGPFSGVCNNGLIACDAGTFSNCRYLQWQASRSLISLAQVPQESLGACYCINNYCGANLALINSQKVLSDLAGGITHALNAVYPRLAMAQATYPDPTQVIYYGNQSGCGTSTQPETYYNNSSTGSLPAAGVAAASDPSSDYYKTLNSPAGQSDQVSTINCSVNRQFDLVHVDKNSVIQVVSRSHGTTMDCGAGCVDLQLGVAGWGNHSYCARWSGCDLWSDTEQVRVSGGQYVQSATFTQYTYDDYGQEWINGNLIWTAVPSWTSPNQPISNSCETVTDHASTPNKDVSAFFQTDGIVSVKNNISTGGCGNGWSDIQIHVKECQLQDSYISDGCAAAEANSNCQLKDETADGVPTYRNYVPTGLSPVPHTQDVATSACDYGNVTEPYFVKQRTYACRTGSPPPYDYDDAVQRYRSIHSTFDPGTGDFTDRTVTTAGGTPTYTRSHDDLPQADVAAGCTLSCETSIPQMGGNVGDQVGATQRLNATGLPLVYSFKQCTSSGVCPVNAGETVVQTCACRNGFARAASMMQTLRMAGQDSICTTGP